MKVSSVGLILSPFCLSFLAIVGCGQIESQRKDVTQASADAAYARRASLVGGEVLKVISTRCVSCHNPENKSAGIDLSDIAVIADLREKIASEALSGNMPKDSPLSPEEMAAIKAWQDAGYPLDVSAPPEDGGGKGETDETGKPSPLPPVPVPVPSEDEPSQNDCSSQSKCSASQN